MGNMVIIASGVNMVAIQQILIITEILSCKTPILS